MDNCLYYVINLMGRASKAELVFLSESLFCPKILNFFLNVVMVETSQGHSHWLPRLTFASQLHRLLSGPLLTFVADPSAPSARQNSQLLQLLTIQFLSIQIFCRSLNQSEAACVFLLQFDVQLCAQFSKECFIEAINRPSQLNLCLLNLLGFVGLFIQYLNHVEVTKCYTVFLSFNFIWRSNRIHTATIYYPLQLRDFPYPTMFLGLSPRLLHSTCNIHVYPHITVYIVQQLPYTVFLF